MTIRVAFVAAMMALSGCTTSGLGGRIFSPGGGTGSPGAANVAVAGTIIAAMDGGLIGGTIGSKLDEADRRTALQAEYRALEYSQAGNTVDWRGASRGRQRRGDRGATLSGRFAGLPPVFADGLAERPEADRARHRLQES